MPRATHEQSSEFRDRLPGRLKSSHPPGCQGRDTVSPRPCSHLLGAWTALRAGCLVVGHQTQRLDERAAEIIDLAARPASLDLAEAAAEMTIIEHVQHPAREVAARGVVLEHGTVDSPDDLGEFAQRL